MKNNYWNIFICGITLIFFALNSFLSASDIVTFSQSKGINNVIWYLISAIGTIAISIIAIICLKKYFIRNK
jgi:hypothetical protein